MITFNQAQLDELAAIDSEGGHKSGHPAVRSVAPSVGDDSHRVKLIAKFRDGSMFETKIPPGQPYRGPGSVEWTQISPGVA